MSETLGRRAWSGRGPSADGPENLPYTIEVWNDAETKVQRVIARAHSASLARAIFKAACEENPHRCLKLRKAACTLASSEG